MSYYIWLKHPELNSILNDNNPYLKQIYDFIQDDKKLKKFENEFNYLKDCVKDSKEEYTKLARSKKPQDIFGWLLGSKYYCRMVGLYPLNDLKQFNKDKKFSDYPVDKIFKEAKITFTTNDALKIYDKYKNTSNCILLLDPPYLSVCNDFYLNPSTIFYKTLFEEDLENINQKYISYWMIIGLQNFYLKNMIYMNILKNIQDLERKK